MAAKTCPRCKESKAAAEFAKNGYCKPCNRAKSAEYAAKRAAAAGGVAA